MGARNPIVLLAVAACAAVISGCAAPPATPADPAAQRLVGRWSQIHRFNDVRDELTIDLAPDATVRVKVRRHARIGIREYTGSGTWRVDGPFFVSELDFPGPLDAVAHLAGRHRIVTVTEWEWVSEFTYGEQLRAWRYPK
jgi:hypothetical protein